MQYPNSDLISKSMEGPSRCSNTVTQTLLLLKLWIFVKLYNYTTLYLFRCLHLCFEYLFLCKFISDAPLLQIKTVKDLKTRIREECVG